MAEIALAHEALLEEINRTETKPGQGAFWWLGQHTFIVKAGGKIFYIDPWFAPVAARQTPSLLAFESAHRADFVLVSHGHSDHLCPETLRGIRQASPGAVFVCPRPEASRMRDEAGIPAARLFPLNAGETLERDGVRILAIKAKHESFDEDPTLGFPYLGYVVQVDGLRFYHAGDCVLYDGLASRLRQLGRYDVVFLPINGRNAALTRRGWAGNFTYQEAVELAGGLRPGLAVPTHYDMFVGNQEDPAKFVDFLEAKYPGIPSWVGKAGERVMFGQN
jgi:L-ascorbate metabolism protein UlaG (beta-lactamase superfamily)